MHALKFSQFIAALGRDLQAPLPGRNAQFDMAPRPRPGSEAEDIPAPDARRSSVLILFYRRADDVRADNAGRAANQIYLPLILRPTYPGVHSGQIGLPGGGFEPQDDDLVATALRETQEEIGVAPSDVTVLGVLSTLYIRPSNNLVLPVVGWTGMHPSFIPDTREVAALIEAPLDEFLDPGNRHTERWQLRDRTADVPIFNVQDQAIWGATAMILSELLALPTLIAAANGAQA